MSSKENQLSEQTFENLFITEGIRVVTELSDLSIIETESENVNENDPDNFVDYLPDEIWLKIFQQFRGSELCMIGLTSKRFLKLTRDPSLWTCLCLVDFPKDTTIQVTLISRCSQLSEISITASVETKDLIIALANSCHQLMHLSVNNCQPLTYMDLSVLAKGCRMLVTINLEGTGWDNGEVVGGAYDGCNKWQDCPCPDRIWCPLFVELCKNFHSKGLELIAEYVDNLESLNIDDIKYLSDVSMYRFIELRGQKIKQLWIDGESLTDDSLGRFEKMENLELLSISCANNMESIGLASISKLENLEWLKLIGVGDEVYLEPEDFVICFSLGHLKNLVHLDLSFCFTISDAGIISVAENCPRLVTLCLTGCTEITDVGISTVVNNCQNLNTLNLCGLDRLMGSFLPSINQLLVGLQLLDLEMCPNIEQTELQNLIRQNMDLVIKDFYGVQVILPEWQCRSPCRNSWRSPSAATAMGTIVEGTDEE